MFCFLRVKLILYYEKFNFIIPKISNHQTPWCNQSNLEGLFGYDEEVVWHHVEALGELREAGAEVHFALELHEYVLVVEVGVREEPVQSPHDLK